MRKIILNVAMSLDGLIEGPNGEFDWCFTDQDYRMTNFLERIDAVLYGRKSYEVMMKEGKGKNPFDSKQSFVVSSVLSGHTDYTLINGDVLQKVKELKNSTGNDIWLFGGAELTASLMQAKLVDELMLAVHPIILGKGKPLFNALPCRVLTKLIASKPYSSGLVAMHYSLNN
ncbi:MAG: dihydrofolate reductase family protein [Cyclobacteriaceae bacterium]